MPTRYVLTTRPVQLLTEPQHKPQDAKLELPPAKRQRSLAFNPSTSDMEIHDSPQSMAEITNAIMQAKVDLANTMLALDPEILLQDIEHHKKKRATTSAPAKRKIDRNHNIEKDGLVGGFRLRGYDQVWHIVLRTIESDTRQVNLKAAAIAEVSSNLQELRRDPRKHIALRGVPELSDITDVTEPESSLALERPALAADAKSPTKREPQLSSPIKARRLSDTMDRAIADQVGFAPVDTLCRHPGAAENRGDLAFFEGDSGYHRCTRVATPRGIPRQGGPEPDSVGVRAAVVAAKPARGPNALSLEPTRSLDTPNGSTPTLPSSAFRGIDAGEGEVFNFGCTSNSFTALPLTGSLAAKGGSRRSSGSATSGRRKSEPLIRSLQRRRTAGRASLSPNKLSFDAALLGAGSAGGSGGEGFQTPEAANSPNASNSSFETPAISWGKLTGRPRAPIQATPQISRAVFNVDARQNPDIFGGAQAASESVSAVDRLAKIAEEHCDGQAKVVISQERDRLFVRFKLPLEYASKFADSARNDESRFTTTPSAISSSPRITFKGHHLDVGNVASPTTPGDFTASANTTVDHHASTIHRGYMPQDETLVVPDFAPSPVPAVDNSLTTASLDHVTVNTTRLLETPTMAGIAPKTSPGATSSPIPPADDSLIAASLDHATVNTTQLLETPTMAGIAFTSSPGAVLQTPAPFAAKASDVTVPEPSDAEKEEQLAASQTSPSFTPVNTHVQRLPKTNPYMLAPAEEKKAQESQHTKRLDFDSPGRDYMRDFIKRSKPKRLSTTETGSPIAPPSKRHPLVAKSPNTESPQKAKRKADEDELAHDPTPLKKGPGRPIKRTRRQGKSEPDPDAEQKTGDAEQPTKPHMTGEIAARLVDSADGDQDAAEMQEAPVARRSSRLRNQKQPTTAPKSSIPTAIKLGGRSGASRGPAVKKTTQPDLSSQTRENTVMNKGNAEYPVDVLARQASESEDMDGDASDNSDNTKKPSKKGTNVGWKEPLATHKEVKTEKPKRGRPAKAKATIGNTGVTKPAATAKPSATATKQRTAKVAAKMGMSGNGTPARPARVTRSSARNKQ
ncbi:dextranase [Purpureocillium lavendulum]|uniref:Dextranase n=1 Tax=Purpureocillium lavendulum TaxID=1247861 RepID=A0AB34FPL4_9HYPO|nr:dextranase [Purpureocillium lavendulum]